MRIGELGRSHLLAEPSVVVENKNWCVQNITNIGGRRKIEIEPVVGMASECWLVFRMHRSPQFSPIFNNIM
jgi:hypothetical protein